MEVVVKVGTKRADVGIKIVHSLQYKYEICAHNEVLDFQKLS